MRNGSDDMRTIARVMDMIEIYCRDLLTLRAQAEIGFEHVDARRAFIDKIHGAVEAAYKIVRSAQTECVHHSV